MGVVSLGVVCCVCWVTDAPEHVGGKLGRCGAECGGVFFFSFFFSFFNCWPKERALKLDNKGTISVRLCVHKRKHEA